MTDPDDFICDPRGIDPTARLIAPICRVCGRPLREHSIPPAGDPPAGAIMGDFGDVEWNGLYCPQYGTPMPRADMTPEEIEDELRSKGASHLDASLRRLLDDD